ncbi:hypothetical protein AB434_3443 [Heyndrickxia coagulans]|uniref:Uncharacterized protein n=1 Tax=Heyndrickxia coagulans TaxID=1398 RepID=A0AAN0T5W5_HEYCO|nr:hypothetical protein SB48_HM08orf02895 [Heyndrickxia coagulans]AKN55848.1 hypothetical protein AB434_3443 [Heyndrickxia coagulans]
MPVFPLVLKTERLRAFQTEKAEKIAVTCFLKKDFDSEAQHEYNSR